jgi:hypothetical protein
MSKVNNCKKSGCKNYIDNECRLNLSYTFNCKEINEIKDCVTCFYAENGESTKYCIALGCLYFSEYTEVGEQV